MNTFTDLELFGIESTRDQSLPIRNTTRIIIIDEEEKIGLVENKWPPHWYDLPGGGCEPDEDFIDCARRECMEEMGVEIASIEQIAVYDRSDRDQGKHFYVVFF